MGSVVIENARRRVGRPGDRSAHASLVLTDSGGVQEETTYLGVPCLTARLNTERPATITHGTNRLVASRPADLIAAAQEALADAIVTPTGSRVAPRPELWDGHAATRLVAALGAVAGS